MPDPLVLAAAASLLAYGIGHARRPAPSNRLALIFAGGVVAAVVAGIALDGPAHETLTGHMVQHLVLWVVAAPLVAAGAPLPTLLWALPAAGRDRALRWWRAARRVHERHWGTWVGVAVGAQAVVIWGWHAPALYQAALRSDVVHGAEHLAFTTTAVAFWWAVAGGRRAGRAGEALALFVAAFPGTALGAAMLLAPAPWYAAYGDLGDQQAAAVVMWSGIGITYVLAAVVLFGRWLARLELSGRVPAR